MDSLLKGQIENLKKTDSRILKFIASQSPKISIGVAVLIFCLGMTAMYLYTNRLDAITQVDADRIMNLDTSFEEKVSDALRALLARELAPGQKISALSVFGLSFVASITAAIMLGVLTEKAAVRLSKSSRVKLTRLSESRAVDDQVMFKRRVAAFVGAQVLNVAVGLLMILLGNILSEYLVL